MNIKEITDAWLHLGKTTKPVFWNFDLNKIELGHNNINSCSIVGYYNSKISLTYFTEDIVFVANEEKYI